MAIFSVIVVTAAPPGQAAEAGGAYVKIDGRETLLRSVELFLNREGIKQIQLVVPADTLEEAKRKFGGHLSFSGVKLISGGPRVIDQCAAAADKLSADVTHVLVHDAARPAVPFSDIDALLDEAQKHPAVTLAAPIRAGLIEVEQGAAVATHSAERFMQLQTPQGFSRERFLKMVQSRQEPHGSEFRIVKGSPLNIRLGGAGDATLAKAMLNLLPKPKIKPPSSPFEEAQW